MRLAETRRFSTHLDCGRAVPLLANTNLRTFPAEKVLESIDLNLLHHGFALLLFELARLPRNHFLLLVNLVLLLSDHASLFIKQLLLCLDLRLLLLDGVDEHYAEPVILDPFDLALAIAKCE